MAGSVPVELRRCAAGLGGAHAKRVLEAVAMCLGVERVYTIADTPEVARLREMPWQR
jgi:hypothetical protein